jgi:adenylate cyclase
LIESPPKIEISGKIRAVWVGSILTVTLIIGLLSYSENRFFQPLDHFFHDRYMRMAAVFDKKPGPFDAITIVDIDEASLAAVGQWPWPRYRLARLVQLIHESEPRAMAMDMVFPEPDQASLKHIAQRFKTELNIPLPLTEIPRGLEDNDLFVGLILARTRMVGARFFSFDHTGKDSVCKQPPFDITDPDHLLSLPRAAGMLCNTPAVEIQLQATGFINSRYDTDGLLRRIPLLIEHQAQIHPHLCLALLMQDQGISTARVIQTRTGPCIQAGPHLIPVTREGFAALRFSGPAFAFPYLSAVDILNREFDKSDIQDRMVFLGSSAMGLNDLHQTVFDPHLPGVEINAVLMDNILNNDLIILPLWAGWLKAVVCMVSGLFMTGLFYRSVGPARLLAVSLAWVTAVTGTSLLAYGTRSVFISPAGPVATVLILFLLVSLCRLAMEKQAAFTWYQRLSSAQQLTMEAMVSMVETRDPETGEHIVRTQHYARAIAEHLRDTGFFKQTLTDRFIKNLFLSVPLHDIGKVGTPDRILLKPGRLTEEEFEIMKQHAQHGRNIITRAARKYKDSNYLAMGSQIAGTHHEKWNGKGYPSGLSGTHIPLAGRIMAIADVYDALISERCYKPPFSHEKAMAIILEEKGNAFDPVVVDAFFQIEDRIRQIANAFQDTEEYPA